jgi:hypothetical protein
MNLAGHKNKTPLKKEHCLVQVPQLTTLSDINATSPPYVSTEVQMT